MSAPRQAPPTRFRRVRELSKKELDKLKPQEAAAYQAALAHDQLWGHLPPQVSKHLVGISQLSLNAVENHAKSKATDPCHFAAAKAYFKWPLGKELSPAEYDAALDEVLGHAHGR